LIRQETRH
jgi:hypothetical protein